MIVKGAERQKRTFKGADFLVGAVGERMMVTLMTFKEGQGEPCEDYKRGLI